MRYRKRKWHELDLLCRAGVGIPLLAPAICRTLRDLIGADAVSLFWLDEQGMPAGVFHEHAADSALDLFVNEYDRLFTGPSDINVSQIASRTGRPVGHLMNPTRDYYLSNTFNLLVRASGHFHTLDLRVDVDHRPRAVVMLFREQQRPFGDQDAFHLAQALPYLRRAVEQRSADSPWERLDLNGYLLVDRSGTTLLKASAEVSRILKACTIVGQNVRLAGQTTSPPRFVQELCRRLEAAETVLQFIDTPIGRLRVTGTQMHSSSEGSEGSALISLEIEQSKRLRTIENLLDLPLSPLQRSIALVAALGGSRHDSLISCGVTNEALKKHLAVIYRTAGVNSWEALTRVLQ